MSSWVTAIILVVGLALLWWMSRRVGRRLITDQEREAIISRWQEVEKLMEKDRAREAIFEADKLLDFIFQKIHLRGETFADRLKNAERFLPNYQKVWVAHKLRNKLAHELDFQLTPQEAQQAIDIFDQTIRKLSNF